MEDKNSQDLQDNENTNSEDLGSDDQRRPRNQFRNDYSNSRFDRSDRSDRRRINPNLKKGTFNIDQSKQPNSKTVVSKKDGTEHELFEFWVVDDNNQSIHCVGWDNLATKLKENYDPEAYTSIELVYKKRDLPYNDLPSYTVRRYTLIK